MLEWAAASEVVLPDAELEQYGRTRLDPGTPEPELTGIVGRSPAVLRGLIDRLAGEPPEVAEALLAGPAGAHIRRFIILPKELDADDGELTRTQKVRRGFIAERYASLIKALYDGSKDADISTEVTFEDGRKGTISARVKIRDMKSEPAPVGKAA